MSISQEKFKQMLKEKGLKVTNQRLLVLEVLAAHRDRHMTAEDIYELVKEEGPAHDRTFTMNVIVDGIVLGTGTAKSKKEAEQEAAHQALEKKATIRRSEK